jgi:SAM-dependent methyltransferase
LPALYDLVVRPGPCEPFYRDLVRKAGGPVLELACGTGRLTLALARENRPITGLDLSIAMLATARAKAARENLAVTFVQENMATFDLGQRFALVVLAGNSLAHLTTTEDLRGCLRSVRRHLAPGGLFAFDIVNPDLSFLARPSTRAYRLDLGPTRRPASRSRSGRPMTPCSRCARRAGAYVSPI